jgi:hypothetical protein
MLSVEAAQEKPRAAGGDAIARKGGRDSFHEIPGLAERVISLYSVADAERVGAAVDQAGATAQRPPQIPTSSGAWRP